MKISSGISSKCIWCQLYRIQYYIQYVYSDPGIHEVSTGSFYSKSHYGGN